MAEARHTSELNAVAETSEETSASAVELEETTSFEKADSSYTG